MHIAVTTVKQEERDSFRHDNVNNAGNYSQTNHQHYD